MVQEVNLGAEGLVPFEVRRGGGEWQARRSIWGQWPHPNGAECRRLCGLSEAAPHESEGWRLKVDYQD